MVRYSNDRVPTDVSTTTLPAGYYTDPAYFAREQDRLNPVTLRGQLKDALPFLYTPATEKQKLNWASST